MIEGSGSIYLTNGSGSGRPKTYGSYGSGFGSGSATLEHCKCGMRRQNLNDIFCVQVRMAKDALQRSEESAELLAEKSMVAEQEAMLLQQKAR